jgi:S1-C subfamily serine protease
MVGLLAIGALKVKERSRTSADYLMQSVVAIGQPGFASGGGVVLEGGRYVLTVNHVIEGMVNKRQGIVITYRDGSTTDAAVVKRNRHFDIALLEVERPQAPGLKLANGDDIRIGDHVRAFGHPFRITWMVSDGIVSRMSYFPPGVDGRMFVIWTTAWIESGNSGGPLVNDRGEVVGLIMAYANPRGILLGAQHLNLCVSGSEIHRFLNN